MKHLTALLLVTLASSVSAFTTGCATSSSTEASAASALRRSPGIAKYTLTDTFVAGHARAFTLNRATDSSTDEFIRVGTTLTLAVPEFYLWNVLYTDVAEPYDNPERAQKVKLRLRIEGFKGDVRVSDDTLQTSEFSGGAGRTMFDMIASTAPYVVPNVDTLKLTGTLFDEDAPSVTKAFAAIESLRVYGADTAERTFVFDEDFGRRRERVIEDSNVLAGTSARVIYSTWRADNVSRRYELEGAGKAIIGRGRNSGARDQFEDIRGKLEHEVALGATFDGLNFEPEKTLTPVSGSFLLRLGQDSAETRFTIPRSATTFDTYFHVKTFVVVDYSDRQYHEVTLKDGYTRGSRQLVSERWDNRGDVTGQNYQFPIATP